MKRQIRSRGRRLAERLAPTAMASVSAVPGLRQQLEQANRRAVAAERRARAAERRASLAEQQVATQGDRIASLEAEVQETRRLSRHVAEVTDVVQEALLPATTVDPDQLRHTLERYADSF